MRKIDPELHERLARLVSSMGYELVGCEKLPQGRQFIFRIYIDAPKGITVEDCSRVSNQVSAMLDVSDLFHGSYTLEVSSPGLDRPLFEIAHFRKYVEKHVKIRLRLAVNGRRQYKGILQRVEGEDIYLKLDDTGEEMKVGFDNVEKAHLISEL